MRWLVAILMIASAACSHTPLMRYTGPDMLPVVEDKSLPASPDETVIPPSEDWVLPLMTGEAAPKPGVLFSPEKTARAKAWQIGYIQIRGMYEADRAYWKSTRAFYEIQLKQANVEIDRLQPSWWDSHKAEFGFATGVVIGVATTILIVYGVDQVEGN